MSAITACSCPELGGPHHATASVRFPSELAAREVPVRVHRANVGEDVWVTGYNNSVTVSVPPVVVFQPKTWVGSSIPVTGSGAIKRVRLLVNASNASPLDLQLIAPGAAAPIPVPKVPADGNLKGIFYVDGAGLSKTGTWRLEVASTKYVSGATAGKLYDWRIEFE